MTPAMKAIPGNEALFIRRGLGGIYFPKHLATSINRRSQLGVPRLVKHANYIRTLNGYPPLKLNFELTLMARDRARQLYQSGSVAPVAPGEPTTRAATYGFKAPAGQGVSELVTKGFFRPIIGSKYLVDGIQLTNI
jgi:hypothetical protein